MSPKANRTGRHRRTHVRERSAPRGHWNLVFSVSGSCCVLRMGAAWPHLRLDGDLKARRTGLSERAPGRVERRRQFRQEASATASQGRRTGCTAAPCRPSPPLPLLCPLPCALQADPRPSPGFFVCTESALLVRTASPDWSAPLLLVSGEGACLSHRRLCPVLSAYPRDGHC